LSADGSNAWEPLLDGELRRSAQRAVDEICEEVATFSSDARINPQLLAGCALLHAYLAVARQDGRHSKIADRFLESAIDALAETPMRPALHGGFTGLAWIVEHLQHPPFTPAGVALDSDSNSEIDEALLNYLAVPRWNDVYDLIGGLVGFGVYALERLPRPSAVACIGRVVDHLDAISIKEDGGVTWWTPAELLPPIGRTPGEKGNFNLGVSHGVPGVIGFLAQTRNAGQVSPKLESMLAGAISWLLKQKLPKGAGSVFAHATGGNSEPRPSRAAWCYGDPGISAVLLAAARSADSTEWEAEALQIGLAAASRDPARCGVNDGGLCHGAAGLGHVYNRLFHATGEGAFADASRLWFERALQMRKAGQGVAGFAAHLPKLEPTLQWQSDRDFLMGATGIALALLAATSTVEPLWDRLLLTALQPRV